MDAQFCKPGSPLVSVIVPVFNGVDFIGRCLDSLLAQTLRELEIIVVDDGSHDATPELLRAYARRFANIRIVRQANAGVSIARNFGLTLARGEYVAFADADDTAAPFMYQALANLATQRSLDVAVCNAWVVVGNQPQQKLFGPGGTGATQCGLDWLLEHVARRTLKHHIWCHLYRRDFLVRERLAFEPGMTHQDIIWTNRVMLAAQRVAFLDEPLYRYRLRAGSLSNPRTSARRIAAVRDYVRVARLLDQLANRLILCDAARMALRYQAADEGLGIFHQLQRLNATERRVLHGYLRRADFLPLLWRNAQTLTQKRRVLRRGSGLHLAVALGTIRTLWVRLVRTALRSELPSQLGGD